MWCQIPITDSQFYFGKAFSLNKDSETAQPALADPVKDFSVTTFKMLDLKLIQILLIVMTLIFTCYLLIKLILWTYDYLNTKYLSISSNGLTYLKALIMDKTNIYLHLYDFTMSDSVNLYMGTIFENPEDIDCEGQFVAGRIALNQQPSYDFIDLK